MATGIGGGLALGIREQECEWEVEDADAVAVASRRATASRTGRWPPTFTPGPHDPLVLTARTPTRASPQGGRPAIEVDADTADWLIANDIARHADRQHLFQAPPGG